MVLIMYKYHLEDVEWGRFFIKDIFSIENCKCSKVSSLSLGDTPYVGATNRNNGVLSFVKKDDELMTAGNCIAFICDGEGSIGYSIYKGEDFIGSTTVKVGRNKYLNKYNSMFITTISDRVRSKYNFGFKRNEKHLKKEILQLPVDSEGNPNWHFMEEYIKERESKKRQELKDYYKNRLLELVISPEVLTDVEWGEFFISDIFDTVQRGKRLTKANQIDGEIPYISSTALNNGVDNFIGNTEKVRKSDNDLTLANSGSVGACFYHNYEYIASDHVTSLKLPNGSDTVYKFISVILGRLEEKYSFNREINDTRIKREKILLPIDKDGNPNWTYMEKFVKNIEKKQIENVLKYLDEYIYIYIMYNHFDKVDWKEFFLDEICNINSGVRLTKANMNEGKMPFIGATDSNNGITNFVSNTNKSLDKNALGVNYNGSVVENFYHPYECIFSDDVKRISFKEDEGKNKYCYLFLKQMILQQKEKYRYAYKFNGDRMARQKIMMPVDKHLRINFDFMKRYITSKELKYIVELIKNI